VSIAPGSREPPRQAAATLSTANPVSPTEHARGSRHRRADELLAEAVVRLCSILGDGDYHPPMTLTVAVLGQVEVRRDGDIIAVPTGRTTELLIRLALDAGVPVRTDLLIADLWGSSADATARNTLQAKVSLLRRAIGDAAAVIGARGGYTLQVDPANVDALEVLRRADSARSSLARGDATAALAASAAALALFGALADRGELLPGGGDGDWLMPRRARLDETRLALFEDNIDARLRLGDAGDVVADLQAAVLDHPLREGLWVRLITVLYRDGRQAEALAAHRRIRHLLGEELGLDPGPELRAVEQQILRGDPATTAQPFARPASTAGPAPPAPASGPATPAVPDPPADAPVPRAVRPGHVPGLLSELVGRRADLPALADLLHRQRLITIVGPAGVGKTRLAVEVARSDPAPDGAWLVRLENVRAPGSPVAALCQALNVNGSTQDQLLARLTGADLLLILDNCEHLLDPVAEVVGRLLDAVPGVRILATSQMPLDLDGEIRYQLDPLAPTEARELFAVRAAGHRRSFVNDPATEAAIGEVCQRLDGLPLAIELAASRTKVLSVQEISRRLDDRFGLLTETGGRRPLRHRALGTAIAWSYELLFPDDRRGLWALACFSGGAGLGAAEHVAVALGVPEAAAVEVIGRLADRSLVAVEVGVGGSVRYRLLESVREFALARLDEAGLADTARNAHLEWFGRAAQLAAEHGHGPQLPVHVALVRDERSNIDHALAWSAVHDPVLGLRIAVGFGWVSVFLGEGAVAGQRLRQALKAAGPAASAADRARAFSLIGWDEAAADVARAERDAEQAIILADRSDDPDAVALSRFSLAFVLLQQGRPADVLDVLDTWRDSAGNVDGSWNLGVWCALVGYAGLALGAIDRIRAACEEAADLVARLGDGWLASQFEANLGQLAQAEHRYAEAVIHFDRAATAAREIDLPATEGFHLTNLGRAQELAGDDAGAITSLQRAIDLTRSVGLLRVVATARVRLGRLLRATGEIEQARSALQAADDWMRASGGGEEAALAQCLLAAIDAQEHLPGAAERLAGIARAAATAGDPDIEVLAVDAVAALDAEVGNHAAATAGLERADRLMGTVGSRLTEADRVDARRARAVLCTGTGLPGRG
jgi:predicted ATPase/DNA-binding SARP family transcriptional activator